MKARLLNLLKFIIGIGLLVLLFWRIPDRAALWRQVMQADKGLLLAGVCCYTAAVALSALKWGVLLRAAGIPVALPRLLAYQWVAEFFNNIFPGQVGGDVMRGYALAGDTRRTADATASVLIDRFIGLLIFMFGSALAAVSILWWGRPNGDLLSSDQLFSMRAIALGSSALTLLLASILAILLSGRLKVLAEWLLTRLPFSGRLLPIWQKLAQAFQVYRHQPRALLAAAFGSLLIILLTSINIWLIARALQPGGIGLVEVLAINPMITFIGLIASIAPGGIGVRQGAFVFTFLLVGAAQELGLAVGLMQHLISILVGLPGALLWLSRRQPAVPPAASPAPVVVAGRK
jgi:glycosyltransferase 2 family protein